MWLKREFGFGCKNNVGKGRYVGGIFDLLTIYVTHALAQGGIMHFRDTLPQGRHHIMMDPRRYGSEPFTLHANFRIFQFSSK